MTVARTNPPHNPQVSRRSVLQAGAVLIIGAGLGSLAAQRRAQATAPTAEELLPNPGFEELSGGFPTHWRQFDRNYPATAVHDLVRNGATAVRLVDPDTSVGTGIRSDNVAVEPGYGYQASVYMSVDAGAPSLYLEFWNESGTRVKVSAVNAAAAPGWQLVAVRDFAPDNAATATLLLYSSSINVGTATCDDASLVEVPPSAFLQIPNSDFEQVAAGVPALWTNLNKNVPYVSSSAHSVSGDKSAAYLNDSWTAKGGFRSSRVPITPGVRYSASAAAFNEQGSPIMSLEFWNASGTRVEALYGLAGLRKLDWQQVACVGTAPTEAAFATVLLYSDSVPNVTYWDDARIDIVEPEPVRHFTLRNDAHPRYNLGPDDVPAMRALATDTTANPLGLVGKDLADGIIAQAEAYTAETSFGVSYFNGYVVHYDAPPAQPGPMDPPPGFSGKYPYWSGLGSAIQDRLDTLAAAYTLTGRVEFADKAAAYVTALSGWDEWHDPQFGSRADQFTGYVTQSVLAAYDQLYDHFDAGQRAALRATATSKGLDLIYDLTIPFGGQIGGTAPALALGGLVLLGEDDNADKYLTRAYDTFQAYMDARMNSGQNEGMSYTAYSTNPMTKSLDALRRVTGDTSLADHHYLTDMLWRWLLYSAAPPAGFTSYSDALAKGYMGTSVAYLNHALRNGYAGWLLRECDFSESWTLMDQMYWFDVDAPVAEPSDLPNSAVVSEVGCALLRSGWSDKDALVAIRAVDSGFGHNHFDQNSFQIAIGGSWIGRDPGYKDLSGPGPTQVFSSRVGHSTLEVDGDGQDQLGGGLLAAAFLSPSFDYVVGSAAGAYINPPLSRFDRTLARVDHNRYVMVDQLSAPAPHEYDWVMFNGPLYIHAVDGVSVDEGRSVVGDTFYGNNGNAEIWGFTSGDAQRAISFTTYAGAEQYGYQTKVRSPSAATDGQFITALEVAVFDSEFYHHADELIASVHSVGGPAAGTPVYVENAGVTYVSYSGGAGGYMEFAIAVPVDGEYSVDTLYMASSGFGQTRVFVDAQPLGGSYDPAFFALVPAPVFHHGSVSLTAGTHLLRYQNVPAAGSSAMAVSSVRVVPVDAATQARDNGLKARRISGRGATAVLTTTNPQIRSATLGVGADSSWQTEWLGVSAGGSRYRVGALDSDGKFVVAQFGDVAGRPARVRRYAALAATWLRCEGKILVDSSDPVDVSVDANAGPGLTTATVRVADTTTKLAFRADRPQTVSTDGQPVAFDYDSTNSTVTVQLPVGMHELAIQR